MSKDNIDQLFNNLKESFDIEAPSKRHSQRFLNKLNSKGELQLVGNPKQRRRFWKPLIAVAASIILLITLFSGLQQDSNSRDLASVSTKMAETQGFFTITINEELNKLQEESSPETQKIIEAALARIETLEKDYDALKYDLNESGDDNRVIYAMISNFQNRIDILKNTLEQINTIKQFKHQSNENSSTI